MAPEPREGSAGFVKQTHELQARAWEHWLHTYSETRDEEIMLDQHALQCRICDKTEKIRGGHGLVSEPPQASNPTFSGGHRVAEVDDAELVLTFLQSPQTVEWPNVVIWRVMPRTANN